MSILYCTNNYKEFASSGIADVGFDPNYVNRGIRFFADQNQTVSYGVKLFPDYAGDEAWAHFRLEYPGYFSNYSLSDGYMHRFLDVNGVELCRIEQLNGAYAAQVFGDTMVIGGYVPPVQLAPWDVQIIVTAAEITMNLYINDALASTATAANTVGGKGKFRQWDFFFAGILGSDNQDPHHDYSEIIVADEDTRGMRLARLGINSAGTHDGAWQGDRAALADDDFGTGLTSDAAGQEVSNVLAAYAGNQSLAVVAVIVANHLKRGDGGPQDARNGIRAGGVDYPAGAGLSPSETIERKDTIFLTNPATGAAWTTAELAAGIEVVTESLN